MAAGTDKVEDRLSCDDFSYSERNLEVYDSGDGVNKLEPFLVDEGDVRINCLKDL